MKWIVFVLSYFVMAADIERVEQARIAFEQGQKCLKSKDLEGAESLFRSALENYQSPELWKTYAHVCLTLGNPDEAIQSLFLAAQKGYVFSEDLRHEKWHELQANPKWNSLLETAQTTLSKSHATVDQITFYQKDLGHFVHAFRSAQKTSDSQEKRRIFIEEYFNKGTPGLIDFFWIKIRRIDHFVKAVEDMPEFYASLASHEINLEDFLGQIRKGFEELKRHIPQATYQDVTFVVGRLSSSGTVSHNGMLIGFECFLSENMLTHEVDSSLRMGLKSRKLLPHTVLHEFTHRLQSQAGEATLIRAAIFEGGADFFAKLALGPYPELKTYQKFGQANEAMIWEVFKKEMLGEDFSRWVANNRNATEEWPADLGYWVGSRIAEQYYLNSEDKAQALLDLLVVKDPLKILEISAYDGQPQTSP